MDFEAKNVKTPISIQQALEVSRNEVAALPVREWAEKTFNSASEPFQIALWRVAAACKGIRLKKTIGVKLPLSPAYPVHIQVDAWLSLLASLGQGMLQEPQVLHCPGTESEKRALTVFFRPVEPSFLALLDNPARVRGIIDITTFKEPASLDGFNRFADGVQDSPAKNLKMDRFPDVVESIAS